MTKDYGEILDNIFDKTILELVNNSDISVLSFLSVANAMDRTRPKIHSIISGAHNCVCNTVIREAEKSMSNYVSIAISMSHED